MDVRANYQIKSYKNLITITKSLIGGNFIALIFSVCAFRKSFFGYRIRDVACVIVVETPNDFTDGVVYRYGRDENHVPRQMSPHFDSVSY